MTRRTVLIADDEAEIRIMLMKMIEAEYDILSAADGDEAVNLARQFHPDIVLMDIMMPGKNGYDACFQIKKDPTTSDIGVVMISGAGYELNRKLAERVGAGGFITKPFRRDELLETLKRMEPRTPLSIIE